MTALEALRFANMQTILVNPVEITIHRTEFLHNNVEDEEYGGREKTETDLPSFTGRIVPAQRMVFGRSSQDEAGPIQQEGWMLIASFEADLRHGTEVEDTFTVGDMVYNVNRVIPRMYEGQVYAVHAILEEVS